MRVLILALSVLGILVSANAAKAGPSTTNRDLSASVDPATFTDEATQKTEDQIGLDKGKRRDVQRRLTGLGFDTKLNGKFDESTRAVITRWQEARGYPKTGFLNTLQHNARPSGPSSRRGWCSPSQWWRWRSGWPDRRHDGRTVRTQVIDKLSVSSQTSSVGAVSSALHGRRRCAQRLDRFI
jgi:peptidoglycan hydrolase-like protein with peptidoglycan-binding domain